MSNKIFQENPQLSEVFLTADGNAFYTRNSAVNHAKTLKDKTVTRKTNPSKTVTEVDVEAPENATLGLMQTGEDENGNPNLKQIVAVTNDKGQTDLAIVPVNDAPVDAPLNTTAVNLLPGSGTTDPAGTTDAVRLTAKQQLQKDYQDKFGEIAADQFTKAELTKAISTGEKLVAEIENDENK